MKPHSRWNLAFLSFKCLSSSTLKELQFVISRNMALNPSTLPVVHKPLNVVPFEEIQKVLKEALLSNFQDVDVTVVDCPDLTKEPFTLAKPGLGGKTKLVEIGGPPYLLPNVQKDKVYDLKDIAKLTNATNAFIIGAGAGPHPYAGKNCEGIFNLVLNNDGTVDQKTRIAKVAPIDEKCEQEILPNSETRMALLGNLFFSEGKPGKIKWSVPSSWWECEASKCKRPAPSIGKMMNVMCLARGIVFAEGGCFHGSYLDGAGEFFSLKPSHQTVLRVHTKTRIGKKDFIASIRECLEQQFPDKLIGLGGTFLLKEGKAKQHVMRDFSKTPLRNEEELNNWLKFYNMSAPLVAVGTLVNGDGGLDLRVQHFHSFSNHGEAGHYHIDITPETVEYLGYFNIGEEIYRIDAPEDTHTFGRD